MILPLGILSILQVVFIPGFIILKTLINKDFNWIQLLIYSATLSLYINYQFVLILTYFKIYTFSATIIIYIIEFLLLVYIAGFKRIAFRMVYFKDFIKIESGYFKNSSLFLISWLCILFYVSLFISNIGSIFYYNDSYNWNRWATEWASNKFPFGTMHYPQLIPANWSLIYVTTQTTVLHFFSKAIMPLFFIGILLIFYDLAKKEKNALFLWGLIIYSVLMPLLYSFLFIADGNTEILAQFFSLLTFYFLYSNRDGLLSGKEILLAVIFSSSAALTKIAGAYIALLTVMWFIYIVYKNYKYLNLKKIILTAIGVSALYIFNLLWYVIKPMYRGLDQSAYLGDNIWKIIVHAYIILSGSVGFPVFIFIVLMVILSLFNKKINLITFILVIPVIILWFLFFSYDTRNLNVSLPFIAIVSPFGLSLFNKHFKIRIKTEKKLWNLNRVYLITILLLLIISIVFSFEILSGITGFLNRHYFNHLRLNYTVELGYERYFFYFIVPLRILSGILILLYIWMKIKIKYITGVLFILTSIALFINLINYDEEKFILKQHQEEKAVALRALNFCISHYLPKEDKSKILILENKTIDRVNFDNYSIIFSGSRMEDRIPENYFKIYDDFGYVILIK